MASMVADQLNPAVAAQLKGKRVLFPFSFHRTGMPIQAAANKLKREIEKFGLENCLAGNFEEPEEEAAVGDTLQQQVAALRVRRRLDPTLQHL